MREPSLCFSITQQTAKQFFQVNLPNNFDTSFEYNKNSFKVLESLFDSKDDLKSRISDSKDKISRKNYGFLNQCRGKTCLCIADTDIENFNFENFDLTACFHLLYADDTARKAFNDYIKDSSNSGDDLSAF